jgi:hypothetical protein
MSDGVVASLMVVLGMDAGELETNSKKAEKSIEKLNGKLDALISLGKVAGAALLAAVPATLFVQATRNAINMADALDEMSQKVGLSVEQLSRLKYAAEISGVPIDALKTGLQKLSQSMGQIASGETTSAAARSFAALGIAVTDSNGRMRDTQAVILDLADKFAGFRDNASKTALAMNIFGKSGAEIIPFLNAGRDGIAKLSDEADRFGITLSTKTAKGAGELNEALDKLTAISGGKFNRFLEKIMPQLVQLTQYLEDTKGSYGLLDIALDAVVLTLKGFQAILIELDNRLQKTVIRVQGYAEAMQAIAKLDFTAATEAYNRMVTNITIQTLAAEKAVRGLWGMLSTSPASGAAGASGLQGFIPTAKEGEEAGKAFAPIIQSTKDMAAATQAATEAERLRQETFAAGLEVTKQFASPIQLMNVELDRLDQLFRKDAISATTFGKAAAAAAFTAANAYGQAASKIMGNLSQVFGEAKGFAIAQALVNTYEAFTAALKGPPGPPWSYGIAASALAAGMAQVQNIRSTNKGGGGGGGGGGGQASAAAAAGAGGGGGPAPGPNAGQTMFVSGFKASELFTGAGARDMVEMLLQYERDGGSVVLGRPA